MNDFSFVLADANSRYPCISSVIDVEGFPVHPGYSSRAISLSYLVRPLFEGTDNIKYKQNLRFSYCTGQCGPLWKHCFSIEFDHKERRCLR